MLARISPKPSHLSRRLFSAFTSFVETTLPNPQFKYHIVTSLSNSIHLNLALEEYFFQHCSLKTPMLLLYRNDKTIVIGKHQNPWKECHVQEMEKAGVELCRRKSGGGAVYQDLGNSVFSFLNPSLLPSQDFKTMNNSLLIGALQETGIEAQASGRNDLTIQGDKYKISGSAYKLRIRGGLRQALHHGTMLINVDLQALQKYLNPNKLKLQSKGVSSVISRVKNLKEVAPQFTHQIFVNALIDQVKAQVEAQLSNSENLQENLTISEFKEDEFLEVPKIKQIYDQSISWDFKWGSTPSFTHELEHKFSWAYVNIAFDVKKGIVQSAKVWSDCLVPELIDTLNNLLDEKAEVKYSYSEKGMEKLCQRTSEQFSEDPEVKKWIVELEKWLRSSL